MYFKFDFVGCDNESEIENRIRHRIPEHRIVNNAKDVANIFSTSLEIDVSEDDIRAWTECHRVRCDGTEYHVYITEYSFGFDIFKPDLYYSYKIAKKTKMRYSFQPHENKPGWYTVTDLELGIRCDFEAHRFNETQEFEDAGDVPADPVLMARAMRELGDWIGKHHYGEAMPEHGRRK